MQVKLMQHVALCWVLSEFNGLGTVMSTLPMHIAITILDTIHRPVFYLELSVSETGLCLRPQVEPAWLSLIDGASLCLRLLERD
jgi:hypothetical protein